MHYNGANSYLFVNGTEIHKFNAKDSGINEIPLCLGNISKEFSADNMKKRRLNRYVYDFSVDYDATVVDDILDIHKYLMKKICKNMFVFIKKRFFAAITFFSCNALKCVSMNNHKCKLKTDIININSDEPLFYPYSILVNKCIGSCNNVNDSCAKL